MSACRLSFFFFFFNDTATTEIYTLSLHDALPISVFRAEVSRQLRRHGSLRADRHKLVETPRLRDDRRRSEEHTSELQSQSNLVCRLLLEKKKKTITLSVPSGSPDSVCQDHIQTSP